jgi:hypothetical protein
VDFSGITPAAQYAKVSAQSPSLNKQLFSVIVHLYGNGTDHINDNRTADELPPDTILDTTLEITDPLQTKATFSTDQLQDGKYILHVQMLLKSTYPMLNNLSGPTFNDDGTATYQGVLVNGSKGDHVTIYHEKSDVFGLQCPSDAVIALPAERVFQWQYLGAGTFNCYVDGLLKNNAEDSCASPYSLNLKDKKNHTLTVCPAAGCAPGTCCCASSRGRCCQELQRSCRCGSAARVLDVARGSSRAGCQGGRT